jgi:hypothetical protein
VTSPVRGCCMQNGEGGVLHVLRQIISKGLRREAVVSQGVGQAIMEASRSTNQEAVIQGLGQAIMEASRSTHQEGVAQAIVHAFSTPGRALEAIYALALNHQPGCCEQCTYLVPVFLRTQPMHMLHGGILCGGLR